MCIILMYKVHSILFFLYLLDKYMDYLIRRLPTLYHKETVIFLWLER